MQGIRHYYNLPIRSRNGELRTPVSGLIRLCLHLRVMLIRMREKI